MTSPLQNETSEPHEEEKYPNDRVTAIVIDDNTDAVEMFCEYLDHVGIEVVGSGPEGKQAIELYKKLEPEIVFLDVIMPRYDGLFGLEQIRKIDARSKVIILTGDMRQDTAKKLQALKPTGILYKPYDLKELKQMIHDVKARVAH